MAFNRMLPLVIGLKSCKSGLPYLLQVLDSHDHTDASGDCTVKELKATTSLACKLILKSVALLKQNDTLKQANILYSI